MLLDSITCYQDIVLDTVMGWCGPKALLKKVFQIICVTQYVTTFT